MESFFAFAQPARHVVFTQCDICLQTCRMNRGSILPFRLRDDELTCILNKLVDAQTDNMLFLAMCHSTFLNLYITCTVKM
jgi:hypothetical protein